MSTLQSPNKYLLTQYSHGAGCGCKIAPAVLDRILASSNASLPFPNLLVGNEERDDAAVMDLGDGTGIISTTDFFMPIVDDASDFGRIASVNAISDIYAMGGSPLMAIAILGWPINELPVELANQVIEGSRQACKEAGIPLAGGHSIDSPEPIFGLAVTGRVALAHLKRNGGAQIGSKLYLTKGLGVGILSTAQKQGKLLAEHATLARDSMVQLNKIGTAFGALSYVQSMTDVTGFGLLGHLVEMCQASGLSAQIDFERVPVLDRKAIAYYLQQECIPGGSQRNWESYGHQISQIELARRSILCDPQTSGGLLVAVAEAAAETFEQFCQKEGLESRSFGHLVAQRDPLISIS